MADGVILESEAGFGKEQLPAWRPCAVVAAARPAHEVTRPLRRAGWDVYEAENGPQLRRLVRLLDADLAVLDTSIGEEDILRTCIKLRAQWAGGRIVLLGEDGLRRRRAAALAGADVLVPRAMVVEAAVPTRAAA